MFSISDAEYTSTKRERNRLDHNSVVGHVQYQSIAYYFVIHVHQQDWTLVSPYQSVKDKIFNHVYH